jgi:hypothetical protein
VEIEEAIARLEDSLRRLKIQYEMFFIGSAKRPPVDLKREVDVLINTHSNIQIRSYTHRFQWNTLVSKYNALSLLWTKQLKAKEEGGRAPGLPGFTRSAPAPPRVPSHSQPPASSQASAAEPTVLFQVRITDPSSEAESMRRLYEQYLEAQKSRGSGAGPTVKLESFIKQVSKQASDLRSTAGSAPIEFRILKNGDSVSLRARVATQESKS